MGTNCACGVPSSNSVQDRVRLDKRQRCNPKAHSSTDDLSAVIATREVSGMNDSISLMDAHCSVTPGIITECGPEQLLSRFIQLARNPSPEKRDFQKLGFRFEKASCRKADFSGAGGKDRYLPNCGQGSLHLFLSKDVTGETGCNWLVSPSEGRGVRF
jgi:hypothetical protein